MAVWYALLATRDQADYPTGSVVSYGTREPSADELEREGLEVVSLGEQGRGVDWAAWEFDTATRALVPRVIVPTPEESDEAMAASLERVADILRARVGAGGAGRSGVR